MATPNEVRTRIGELYPGDENKGVRHQLYATPGLLASSPSDDEIRAALQTGGAPERAPEPSRPKEGVVELVPVFTADELRTMQAKDLMMKFVPLEVVKVTTREEYEAAAQGFKAINRLIAANEEHRLLVTKPLNDTIKLINAEHKVNDTAFREWLKRYDDPMTAFQLALEESNRKAAEEQKRLAADAKAAADAKVEEAKKNLENARAIEEEDPFLAALGSTVEEAKEHVVDAIRAAAMAPSLVPTVAPVKVTVGGTRTVKRWKYEIVDSSKVERALCEPSATKINARVQDLKAQCDGDITKCPETPGIRIFVSTNTEGGR